MITRRQAISGASSTLVLSVAARAGESGRPETAPDTLFALSGKKPLIRRTFRPPNLETPLADLRQPYTANDAFFVRYHLSLIPEVDAKTWRLRVGGRSAQRSLELSLEELKRGFERVHIAAINQCSGNRRGLFTPRAAGVQWTYGAMGNAKWSGVRLRDVLNRVGVSGDALEVVLDGLDAPTINRAMRAGIDAACRPGVRAIGAGNYGGKLGPYHFHLREVMAEAT